MQEENYLKNVSNVIRCSQILKNNPILILRSRIFGRNIHYRRSYSKLSHKEYLIENIFGWPFNKKNYQHYFIYLINSVKNLKRIKSFRFESNAIFWMKNEGIANE